MKYAALIIVSIIVGAIIMDYVNYTYAKAHNNVKMGGLFQFNAPKAG